jgi:hypothetical protein
MKRKARRYDEGGVTEGQNPRIDDDTRARAMKFVEDASEESRDIKPRAEAKEASKPAPKAKAKEEPKTKEESKPKAETKEEYKSRMEEISKKEPLENVSPEDYVPGGGMLKAGLKAIVGAGARRAAKEGVKEGAKEVAKEGVKQIENKATKQLAYDKAGELAKKRAARAEARTTEMKRSNARNYGIDPDNASRSVYDSLRKNIGDGEFTMKKGGKVAGKLATRGYGKAR